MKDFAQSSRLVTPSTARDAQFKTIFFSLCAACVHNKSKRPHQIEQLPEKGEPPAIRILSSSQPIFLFFSCIARGMVGLMFFFRLPAATACNSCFTCFAFAFLEKLNNTNIEIEQDFQAPRFMGRTRP